MDKEFVTIKTDRNKYRKVFIKDVLYCKADRVYSVIKTIDSEFLYNKPLKELELIFNFPMFIRVNRSYLVNISKCIELKVGTKPELKLINKERIKPNLEALPVILKSFNIP